MRIALITQEEPFYLPPALAALRATCQKDLVALIILPFPVPIYRTDALHKLMVRSKQIGVQAMLKAVEQIERGTVQGQPMDASQVTYFFPKRVDAQRLRRMGRALL